jgi:hypothetical protein
VGNYTCPYVVIKDGLIFLWKLGIGIKGNFFQGIQIGKEVFELSLFAYDMILHLKDAKNSSQKLLDSINSFSKVPGYKINFKNQCLLCTAKKICF